MGALCVAVFRTMPLLLWLFLFTTSTVTAGTHPCGQVVFDAPQGGAFPYTDYRWAVSLCKPMGASSICDPRMGYYVEQMELESKSCEDLLCKIANPPSVLKTDTGYEYIFQGRNPQVPSGNDMQAIVEVTCDPSVPELQKSLNVVDANRFGVTGFSFHFHLTMDCTDPSEGWGWPFLFLLLVLAAAYVGVGGAYNAKVRGLSGYEAIPHLEFWRDVPALVTEGAVFCKDYCCGLVGQVTGRGYEVVA